MFKADYIKEDGYRVDIVFLETEVIGSYKANTLEEAIDKYIRFEEEYYGYSFSDREKELKHKNVEYGMKLKNAKDSIEFNEIMAEVININTELHSLYIRGGFEDIRYEFKRDYLLRESEELKKVGEING